ncbi:chemotaxis protein [Pseudomonas sp. 1D4]|nr:chemotaxis protein [Pseudomonas sp. 1D4]OEC60361.1 chemotaxis protein [Pseudomonas sp. ENNP23]
MLIEIALLVLAVACAALAFACVRLRRQQLELAEEQAKREAARDQRLKELARRLDAYLSGSIRMGEELHELRRVVAPLPDKVSQIEQRDPSSISFTQAARLAGMGASVDDLTHSCGLSKAEAELVSKLQLARKQAQS